MECASHSLNRQTFFFKVIITCACGDAEKKNHWYITDRNFECNLIIAIIIKYIHTLWPSSPTPEKSIP